MARPGAGNGREGSSEGFKTSVMKVHWHAKEGSEDAKFRDLWISATTGDGMTLNEANGRVEGAGESLSQQQVLMAWSKDLRDAGISMWGAEYNLFLELMVADRTATLNALQGVSDTLAKTRAKEAK